MPLDIGIGIVLALLVAHFFGIVATPLFVALGIVCVLAPDLDIVPFFRRISYDHRSYTHYPIVQLFLTAVVYFLLGPVYATLYGLGVLLHLVHDTVGLGWGVAWFWPLSSRKFLFLPIARMQKYGYFMSWTLEEEKILASQYHDPNWIKHYYLSPHPLAFIEYGGLIIALSILYYIVR